MSKECLPWKIQTSSLGQRAIPIKSLGATPLEDFDWNGPFALGISVWIFQGKHSLLIGFLQSKYPRERKLQFDRKRLENPKNTFH